MSERTNESLAVAHRQHSHAAVKIAEIITGGKYGSRKRYHTAYGVKTVMGIADLIDNETQLPELLTDCQELLDQVDDEHNLDHGDGFTDYGYEPDAKKCPTCKWHDEVQALLDRVRQGE